MRDIAKLSALLVLVALLALCPLSLHAATDLTPTDITIAGVDSATAADVTGNTFTNTGYEFIEVINASGAPITVTSDAFPAGGQGAPGGLTVTDPTVSVPATTGRRRIGPFPRALFNNGSSKVTITYSAVTSVTVGVYRLTPSP